LFTSSTQHQVQEFKKRKFIKRDHLQSKFT
jgi:hypothetical protein